MINEVQRDEDDTFVTLKTLVLNFGGGVQVNKPLVV